MDRRRQEPPSGRPPVQPAGSQQQGGRLRQHSMQGSNASSHDGFRHTASGAGHPGRHASDPRSIRQRSQGAAHLGPAAQSSSQSLSLPETLVAAATDSSKPLAARLASLQQLHQALYSPKSQGEALQHLTSIWPPLVGLLWDPKGPLCTAAAAPVGALGALAAQAAAAAQGGAHGGGSRGAGDEPGELGAGGMLFDWLLPVLASQKSPAGAQLSLPQIAAILMSLRNCMAGVDGTTLARYANAVFEMCQSMLEEEGTSPQLVPPLLEVVMQAARHQHSLRARFHDCVDVLLGWALEPSLTPSARHVLARTLLSFQHVWKQQQAFAASILKSLLEDLEGSCGSVLAEAAGTQAGVGCAPVDAAKALGLAPCILAILEASWLEQDVDDPQAAGALMRLCRCLSSTVQQIAQRQRHQIDHEGPIHPPPPDMASTMAELASHVSKLAELAKRFAPSTSREGPAHIPPLNTAQPPRQLQPISLAKHDGMTAAAGGDYNTSSASMPSASAWGDSSIEAQLEFEVIEETDAAGTEPTGGWEGSLGGAMQSLSLSTNHLGPAGITGPTRPHVQVTIRLLDAHPPNHQAVPGVPPAQVPLTGRDEVAANLQEACAAAVHFVSFSLQIPSIGSRPDAVTALLSVLKRWLGVGQVLKQRGAEGELLLMWHSLEAVLFQSPSSSISSLRLCGEANVLQRCAELYLEVVQLSPTAFEKLLTELEGASATIEQLQRAPAPKHATVPQNGGDTQSNSQGSQEAAVVLAFDLQFLSALKIISQSDGQSMPKDEADVLGQVGQHAEQQTIGQPAMTKQLGSAQLMKSWHLLCKLCGPKGVLLLRHHTLWIQAFGLLQTLTFDIPSTTKTSVAFSTGLLRLLTALLTSLLNSSKFAAPANQHSGDVDLGLHGASSGLFPGHAVPVPVAVAALEHLSKVSRFIVGSVAESLGTAYRVAVSASCCSLSDQAAFDQVRCAAHAVATLSATSSSPAVRAAAICCLGELMSSHGRAVDGVGSGQLRAVGAGAADDVLQHVLIADSAVASSMCQALVRAAADFAPNVSHQAHCLLLEKLCPHLQAVAFQWPHVYYTAGSCLNQTSRAYGVTPLSAVLAYVAFASGVQRQHRVFKPAQLAWILDYLRGAAPATVIIGAAGTRANQLQDWLPRVMYNLPDLPQNMQKASELAYEGPHLEPGYLDCSRNIQCLPDMAVFAVHEAARHLVASRLKSYYGGPSQTFAVLDRALHRLQAYSGDTAADKYIYNAWLLLDLMHALEQETFNAHEGSVGRPPPVSTGSLAFFTGNKKVCQDWFLRMQPLLLQEAAASEHHTLTLRLGIARLKRLESQAKQLLAMLGPHSPGNLPRFSPGYANRFATSAVPLGSGQLGGPWVAKLLGVQASQSQAPLATQTSVAIPAAGTKKSAPAGASSPPAAQSDGEPFSERPVDSSPGALLLAATGHQAGGSVPSTPSLGHPHGLVSATASRSLTQQAQQLWHRVADVAAVTARALLMLRDPAGVVELHAYCDTAFKPLLDALSAPNSATSPDPGSRLESLLAAARGGHAERHLLGEFPGGELTSPLSPSSKERSPAEESPRAVESSDSPAGGVGEGPLRDTAWEWLEAVRQHASGQYEAALQGYDRCSARCSAGPVRALLATLQAEAYTAVQDWSGLYDLSQVSDAGMSERLRSRCLALASWGSGDLASAKRQLSQQAQRPAGEARILASGSPRSRAPASGPLQAALTSALARETAALQALLQQTERSGEGEPPGIPPAGKQQGLDTGEGLALPLQRLQLSLATGGALDNAGPVLSCLAPPCTRNNLGTTSRGNPQGVPLLGSSLHLPFSASLLCYSPWQGAPPLAGPPSMGSTPLAGPPSMGSTPLAGPDVLVPEVRGGLPGEEVSGGLPGEACHQEVAAGSLCSLLSAAQAAGCAGNVRQAGALLRKVQELLAPAGPPGSAPGDNEAVRQALQLELSLGMAWLAVQHSAGCASQDGIQDGLQQQLWQQVLECCAAVGKNTRGGVGGVPAAAPITAASALLLLHWSKLDSFHSELVAGGGAAAAMPSGSSSSASDVHQSPVIDPAQLLQQAKDIMASAQLPLGGVGRTGGWRALDSLQGEHAGSGTSLEAEGEQMAALEAELLSDRQPSTTAALQYASLKAALAALPGCSQLWWEFAEWAAEYAEHTPHAGPEQPAAAQQARAAAFTGFCRALSLGRSGTAADDIPVLLQILRMIGGSLHPAALLRNGISAVPVSTWLPVLPQLLATVAASCLEAEGEGNPSTQPSASCSTAQKDARQALLDLLSNLAEAHPAAVLLPALNELREPSAGCHSLESVLRALVEACHAKHEKLLCELDILCDSFTKIAVLWEEDWSSVLQEAGAAASRGLGALQEELESLPEDEQGSALQSGYLFAMAPAVLLIRERMANDAANTPHDERMMGTLQPMIHRLCEQLAQAPSQASDLTLKLQAIKQVAARVGEELKARQLLVTQLAPALHSLQSTSVPVPGAGDQEITIQAVLPSVSVLHTKTRPKKLSLIGADGRQYKYLLKGMEDLRTDERLGQFLNMANAALRCTGSRQLEVQSFSVTPVGRRTGLVQWVENTVPLYQLYTSWHTRKAERAELVATSQSQAQKRKEQSAAQPSVPSKPPKPVEMFYKSLLPALKAAGVDPSSPRATWPLAVMQQVYRTLAAAAPRSMLANELWCAASSPTHWWQRQRAYTQSTAAVSMVGYLLGLGDRHMDNILLHKQHGTVVHLDFNVIFDRGMHLKVPEVVPFRLTPSLAAGLGPSGTEGEFKLYCKQALRSLQLNAQPLRLLLESALNDPLVDWDVEEVEKARRQALDLAAALQLYALLFHQSKQSIQLSATVSAEALDRTMSDLGGYVQLFGQVASAARAVEEGNTKLQTCQAILVESEGLEQAAQSKILQGQQAEQGVMMRAVPAGEQVVHCLQECQAWQDRHAAALQAVLADHPMFVAPQRIWAPDAAPVTLGLATPSHGQARSILQAAVEMPISDAPVSAEVLLQAAAVDDMGATLLAQRARCIHTLSDCLRQYCAAVRLLGGLQYVATSQHGQWAATFQAALALPVPQGFQQASELAPRKQEAPSLLPTWRSLATASAATSSLLHSLESTQKGLLLEKVDLALSANEAQEDVLCLLRSHPSALDTGTLLRAFATFSHRQSEAVFALQTVVAEGGMAAPLDSLQPLVLGYTTAAVVFQQAGSGLFESLFVAADGSSRLDWLSVMVQSLEALASLSLELQLLGPALLALGLSQHAQQVTKGLAGARKALQTGVSPAAPSSPGPPSPLHPEEAELQCSPPLSTEAALETLAARSACLRALLQLLLQLHATASHLAEATGTAGAVAEGGPALGIGTPQSDRHRWLVHAVSDLWGAVTEAAAKVEQEPARVAHVQAQAQAPPGGASPAAGSPPSSTEDAGAAPEASTPGQGPPQEAAWERVGAAWEECSSALAGVVDREVAALALPAVAALFRVAAGSFEEGAASADLDSHQHHHHHHQQQQQQPAEVPWESDSAAQALPQQAQRDWGAPPPAQVAPHHASHADLVPFTDFEGGMVPDEELLGELEPGDSSWEGSAGPQPGAVQWGGEGGSNMMEAPQGGSLQECAGQAPPLVPFTDFDGGLVGEAAGLLEALEGDQQMEEVDSGGNRDPSQPDAQQPRDTGEWVPGQLSAQPSQRLPRSGSSSSGVSSHPQLLATALGRYAGAAGPLAALDSLQYLSGLAIEQCRQQSQVASVELFAFEWLSEEELLRNGIASAALGAWLQGGNKQVQGDPLGQAIPLRCSRTELLSQLQQALHGAAHLQAQVQQWQAGLQGVVQVLERELSATMLFTVPTLKSLLGEQYHWLVASNLHVSSLMQLSQALLHFESSRSDLGAAPRPQLEGWQQYRGVLHQMHQLFEAHLTASTDVRTGQSEINIVQQRRTGALASMQDAQILVAEAHTQLGTHALPLIKATRTLIAASKTHQATAARMAEHSVVLQAALQQANMLRSALMRAQRTAQPNAGLHHISKICASAAEQLQRAARCLANIPEAVQSVGRGLQAAQAVLAQEKRRGEAAAKQAAVAVVTCMGPPMESITAQMEGLPIAKMLLIQLPASLTSLAQQAQQHADVLAGQHSLHLLPGLAELVDYQSSDVKAARKEADSAARAIGTDQKGSSSTARHGKHWIRNESFANATIEAFLQKLDGRWLHSVSDQRLQAEADSAAAINVDQALRKKTQSDAMNVEHIVQQLISLATSDANLARMYEGWMAWV